jgi:SNF2 family DNA or RNA helicase
MDSELRKRNIKEKEHVNKENKVAENKSAQLEKYIWIPITVSLTSLLVVLAILAYFLNQQEQLQHPIKPQRRTRIERTSEEVPYEYNFIKGSVKRITLTPSNTHFANEIAAKGEPVIISNSVAEKWAALDVWTPSYFIAHIPSFSNIQKHHNKTFYYYHASKPMSKLVPSYRCF